DPAGQTGLVRSLDEDHVSVAGARLFDGDALRGLTGAPAYARRGLRRDAIGGDRGVRLDAPLDLDDGCIHRREERAGVGVYSEEPCHASCTSSKSISFTRSISGEDGISAFRAARSYTAFASA